MEEIDIFTEELLEELLKDTSSNNLKDTFNSWNNNFNLPLNLSNLNTLDEENDIEF